MNAQTITTTQAAESKFFGVSVRGILVTALVLTVCAVEYVKIGIWAWVAVTTSMYEPYDLKEPIYSLVLLTVGYYFGKQGGGGKQVTTEGAMNT